MCNIRERHVVGKIQRPEPLWIAVEAAGAKAGRSEFPSIAVDRRRVAKKHFAVAEKIAPGWEP